MAATFNSLPEAQAYARTNGITKYWRVHFTDERTRIYRSLGAGSRAMIPSQRIYMSLSDAMSCIETRAAGTQERTEIETLWTADVSNLLTAS